MDDLRALCRLVVPFASRRREWLKTRREVGRARTWPEFWKWIDANEGGRAELFLSYHSREQELGVRANTAMVFAELGLDVAGKRVLDLGPGYGEAIDVAHEGGAKSIDYVELDPVFSTYNRLKGYARGHRMNQLLFPAQRLRERFDAIWSGGSVVVDQWVHFPRLTIWWLHQLRQMTAPNGTVAIVPYFMADEGKLRLPVEDNAFVAAARAADYEVGPVPSGMLAASGSFPLVCLGRWSQS